MTSLVTPPDTSLETRARQSMGRSNLAIYRMVADNVHGRHAGGGVLLDVGCGTGTLWSLVCSHFARYIGIDAVRYTDFPAEAEFRQIDLDRATIPFPAGTADVVAAVETLEHLENPRAFVRQLVTLTKRGGWVMVTTPNQLSLLSLLTLVVRQRFAAFQDVHYPAHLTALLEVDLRRIASECGLTEVAVAFSHHGRLVLTPWHYPQWLARRLPRALSDNLLLIGRKAHD